MRCFFFFFLVYIYIYIYLCVEGRRRGGIKLGFFSLVVYVLITFPIDMLAVMFSIQL